MDFEFQAMQRDQLLREMVMSSNAPEAVKGFQKYNRWVIDQAVQIARLWEFNLAQDPSIDRQTTDPVSAYGLKMLGRERQSAETAFFEVLKEDKAFLVFFSRSDCRYCHDMVPILQEFSRETGMTVWNASLDETCIDQFKNHCLAGDAIRGPATYLQVRQVPDLVIHNPKDRTWLRIATGVTTADQIKSRIKLFSQAVKSAAMNGVVNAQGFVPSVDFKHKLSQFTDNGIIRIPAPAEATP